jgi:two-component sensor histidine kinase
VKKSAAFLSLAAWLLWSLPLAAGAPLSLIDIEKLHVAAQDKVNGQPKDVFAITERTEAACKRLKNDNCLYEAYRLKGRAHISLDEVDKGRKYLDLAVQGFQKTKNFIGLSHAYRGIAAIDYNQNRYAEALIWHQRSADAADKSGDPDAQLQALIALGANYTSAEDIGRSKTIFDRALKITEGRKVAPRLKALVNTNWASIANRQKEFAAALPKLEAAGEIFLSMQNWRGHASNACEWAQTLIGLKRNQEALGQIASCLASARKHGSKSFTADALEDAARFENLLGNHASALLHANESLLIARAEGSPDLESVALIQKAKALNALGEYRQASMAYDRLVDLQKTVLDEQVQRSLAYARTQSELERTRNAASLQSLRLDQQRKQNLYFLAFIVMAVLAASYTFWQWRKERRLKDAISDRNTQIESQRSALAAALEENRILLTDTNHRTKNSFQVLLSMMNRQLRSGEASKGFEETLGRLKAIAQHHNWLDQYDRGTDMALCDIVKPVIEALETIYGKPNRVDVNVPEVNIGAEQVGTLSLLLNEILANAFKYATPKPSDRINLTASANGDELVLHIADTGPGFSDTDRTIGIGLSIISDLADQLGAEISRSSEERKGTRWEIALSLRDTKQLANAL